MIRDQSTKYPTHHISLVVKFNFQVRRQETYISGDGAELRSIGVYLFVAYRINYYLPNFRISPRKTLYDKECVNSQHSILIVYHKVHDTVYIYTVYEITCKGHAHTTKGQIEKVARKKTANQAVGPVLGTFLVHQRCEYTNRFS